MEYAFHKKSILSQVSQLLKVVSALSASTSNGSPQSKDNL